MPLIWCSISSHGYGHAAQVVPVLNALGQRIPGLRVVLRTTVPADFFAARLQIPWEISHAEQDIGCIQRGPLSIDEPATWTAHQRFQEHWSDRVAEESQAIRSRRPDLVLANISHLAVAAGAAAGMPVVALCSLSWDQILEPFLSHAADQRAIQHTVLQTIRQAYAAADVMIRPAPGLPMPAFKNVRDVPPILQAVVPEPERLRAALDASVDEPIVLVGFGGVALTSLPADKLKDMAPYRFLVDRLNGLVHDRVRAVDSLGMPFGTLLASADILLTKPGYSTVVEAVAHHRRVVYVRRYNFADEQPLVDYLHQYGAAVELAREDFLKGYWHQALSRVQQVPAGAPDGPPPHGAAAAATILEQFL
jgi:hypothetical protein